MLLSELQRLLPSAHSNSDLNWADLEKRLNFQFPEQYKQLMRSHNGAEGLVGEKNYIQFYPVEHLLEENDLQAPGVLFASDGGFEGFAFMRNDLTVTMVPLDPLDWPQAVAQGAELGELVQRLANDTLAY